MKRTGLLGGSFDPVHLAHVAMAEHALESVGLDSVILMPARVSPHKIGAVLAPVPHRLAMLRLAAGDDPRLEVSELELDRDGPSYTLTTVRLLSEESGGDCELSLLLGSDSVRDLATWWRAAELVREVRIIGYERRGVPLEDALRSLARLDPQAAQAVRAGAIAPALRDVSATEVRRRVRAGRPIHDLAPGPVCDYIATHGLYQRD